MAQALQEARLAGGAGEVPVGAVVVKNGVVIASGRNAPIGQYDPSAHAEMMALRAAALNQGNYRLDDCELFVTLEPCAMCAGAMLHARLKRVVYGAPDPKTGAAGSVLNLFDNPRLNHQTGVTGGVMAGECGALLQDFFKRRRETKRLAHSPVREDALRTPEAHFDALPGHRWPAQYLNDLPALVGLRLHYLDAGPKSAPKTYLCLHGSASWSLAYQGLIAPWVAAGHRVVAPDLIGFGKSDKPKKECVHTLAWHRQILLELIERLDLKNINLVLQRGNDDLWREMPEIWPERFADLLVMEIAALDSMALDAPFPDSGHRAALRAFAMMLPDIDT